VRLYLGATSAPGVSMHRALALAFLLATGCPPEESETGDTDTADPCLSAAVPAPTDLTASTGRSESIRLEWQASADAAGFIVERSASEDGPYDEIGRTINLRFDDTGLTSGASFYYVVIAANELGESCPSAPALGSTP